MSQVANNISEWKKLKQKNLKSEKNYNQTLQATFQDYLYIVIYFVIENFLKIELKCVSVSSHP